MAKGFVIAIDGPVAAGKGTIASKLAEELQGFNLYTGAMYRSIALYCLEKDIDLHDTPAVLQRLPEVKVSFDKNTVLLNGRDVTERIKQPDAANGSSVVASVPEVRRYSVKMQQEIAEHAIAKGQIVVSEGRDTATVVFPKADFKMYLTASHAVRAQRRLEQFTEKQISVTLDEVIEQIRTRDEQDMNREMDPLPRNPETMGYWILDNSALSEQETLDAIKKELQERKLI